MSRACCGQGPHRRDATRPDLHQRIDVLPGMTQACARIVERDDPRLHATALFAPEPQRSHLMVVYAFDCELSRASRSSRESLIPRMRLQWWREVLEEAEAGKPPKAHEVGGPLAELIGASPDPQSLSSPLLSAIAAREAELEAPFSREDWGAWASDRFGGLLAAATQVLERKPPPALESVAVVFGAAYTLRHAARMMREGGPPLLESFGGGTSGGLARGQLDEDVGAAVMACAHAGLERLQLARETRREWSAPSRVAALPLLWAERTLRLVARRPAAVFDGTQDTGRPLDGIRLLWRAGTGRW